MNTNTRSERHYLLEFDTCTGSCRQSRGCDCVPDFPTPAPDNQPSKRSWTWNDYVVGLIFAGVLAAVLFGWLG